MCIDSAARKTDNPHHLQHSAPDRADAEPSSERKTPLIPPGATIMRYRTIALFAAVLSLAAPAVAQEAKNDVKGIFLLPTIRQ